MLFFDRWLVQEKWMRALPRKKLLTMQFALASAVLMLMSGPFLFSVGPVFWEQTSFTDFQQATLKGLSVSSDGRVTLAPALELVFDSDQPLIWSLARDSKGNLYAGTGHNGKVFRIDSKGKSELIFTAKEFDIFAAAVDAKDRVYVGSSPDGKIYQIDPDGKSKEFFNPQAKYIWDLALDRAGNLYVATGDKGKIFRVDPSGKGELFFDSKQTHIMTLVLDKDNFLYAGSEPDGLVYKISPTGKAFVVYDSSLREIHALALTREGVLYASGLSEKFQRRLPELRPSGTTTAAEVGSTTITVTANASEGQASPPQEQRAEPRLDLLPFPRFGATRSSIYRINSDHSVETVWNSREENVFALWPEASRLLFTTDSKGRIYQLTPDRKFTLIAEVGQDQASRILPVGNSLYVATSNLGKLYRLGTVPLSEGSIESQIKDAGFVSKWGTISWQGENPPDSQILFYTRSGNSEKPDATWSEWSPAYTRGDGEAITSPSARFIQWKGVLKGNASASPTLNSVLVSYLPQNVRPEINSITVSTGGGSTQRTLSELSGSIPDQDQKTPSGSSDSSGTPSFAGLRPSRGTARSGLTISWQAEDRNRDPLEYEVYYRGVNERNWKLLRKEVRETALTIDSETLPDGKYQFKIVASDAPSNPREFALAAELESEAFFVDNTPPSVEVIKSETQGQPARLTFRASDATSPLRRAEYSLDGGKWQVVFSADGVLDSKVEEFVIPLDSMDSGEHVVALRVFDSSGNVGLAKTVIATGRK